MAYPEDNPPQEVLSNWDNKIYIKTICKWKISLQKLLAMDI